MNPPAAPLPAMSSMPAKPTAPPRPAAPSANTAAAKARASDRLLAWAQPRWQQLAPRERQAVAVAALVCAVGLVWWLALAPALATLRQAPAQHAQLDAQLSHMRHLSALATHLQAQPTRSREERLAALEADTRRRLGDTARVRVSGEQVTVSLGSTSPEALAQWLSDVRANARLTPAEARLSRATDRPASLAPPAPAPNTATNTNTNTNPSTVAAAQSQAPWQGEVVFALGGTSTR